jgi:hypothetical protein
MLSIEEDVVTTEEYKSTTIIDLEYEALEIKFCEFGSQFQGTSKQEANIQFGLPDPPENDNSIKGMILKIKNSQNLMVVG